MKKYKIQREEKIVCVQTYMYEVLAETEEEALEKVEIGQDIECDLLRTEYNQDTLEILNRQVMEEIEEI